jgi:hypothetical protein
MSCGFVFMNSILQLQYNCLLNLRKDFESNQKTVTTKINANYQLLIFKPKSNLGIFIFFDNFTFLIHFYFGLKFFQTT